MSVRIHLCAIDVIAEGGAKGFDIDGAGVFAVRFDGHIHVYRNSCPHLGTELNWLEDQFFDADGAYIQCATHGALFDPATGICVFGPCRGQALQSLACHIESGRLYLDNAPPLTGK